MESSNNYLFNLEKLVEKYDEELGILSLTEQLSAFGSFATMRMRVLMENSGEITEELVKATVEELEKKEKKAKAKAKAKDSAKEDDEEGAEEKSTVASRCLLKGLWKMLLMLEGFSKVDPSLCTQSLKGFVGTFSEFKPQLLACENFEVVGGMIEAMGNMALNTTFPDELRSQSITTMLAITVARSKLDAIISVLNVLLQLTDFPMGVEIPEGMHTFVKVARAAGAQGLVLPIGKPWKETECSVKDCQCVCTDGHFIYAGTDNRLLKIGTGHFGTTFGDIVSERVCESMMDEGCSLVVMKGRLMFRSKNTEPGFMMEFDENLNEVGLISQKCEEGSLLLGMRPSVIFVADGELKVLEVDETVTPKVVLLRSFALENTDGMSTLVEGEELTLTWPSTGEGELVLAGRCAWTGDEKVLKGVEDDVLTKICGTDETLCGVSADGLLYYSGLGAPFGTDNASSFSRLISVSNVQDAAVSTSHALILSKKGVVSAVGDGSSGVLGNGERTNYKTPKTVESLKDVEVVDIAVNSNGSACVSDSGCVYTWGFESSDGELGLVHHKHTKCGNMVKKPMIMGDFGDVSVIGEFLEETEFIDGEFEDAETPSHNCDGCSCKGIKGLRYRCIKCPDYDLCQKCYDADCHVEEHGAHKFKVMTSREAVLIDELDLRKDIKSGKKPKDNFYQRSKGEHTVEIDEKAELPKATSISLSNNHMLIVTKEGDVYGLGSNSNGQLGVKIEDNECMMKPTKLNIPEGVKIEKAFAGEEFSIFLSADGKVFSCGLNDNGQLGREGDCESILEIQNLPNAAVSSVHIGFAHVIAVSDNIVYGWGRNIQKQLGEELESKKIDSPVKLAIIEGCAQMCGAMADRTVVVARSASIQSLLAEAKILVSPNEFGVVVSSSSSETGESDCHVFSSQSGGLIRSETLPSDTPTCFTSDDICGAAWTMEDNKISAFHSGATSMGDSRLAWSLFNPETAITDSKTASVDLIALSLMTAVDVLCHKEVPDAPGRGADTLTVIPGELVKFDRFSSMQFGGSWYYSPMNTDNIGFSVDKEVILAGIGVYPCANPGNFSGKVEICKREDMPQQPQFGGFGQPPAGKGDILTEGSFSITRTDQAIEDVMFDEEITLEAGVSYLLIQRVTNGSQGYAGQNGMNQGDVSDLGLKITFQEAYQPNNNGTGIMSGQMPRLIFRHPPIINVEKKTSKTANQPQVDIVKVNPSQLALGIDFESFEKLIGCMSTCAEVLDTSDIASRIFEVSARLLAINCGDADEINKMVQLVSSSVATPEQKEESRKKFEMECRHWQCTEDIDATLKSFDSHFEMLKKCLITISGVALNDSSTGLEAVLAAAKNTMAACFPLLKPTVTMQSEVVSNLVKNVEEQPELLAREGLMLAAVLKGLATSRNKSASLDRKKKLDEMVAEARKDDDEESKKKKKKKNAEDDEPKEVDDGPIKLAILKALEPKKEENPEDDVEKSIPIEKEEEKEEEESDLLYGRLLGLLGCLRTESTLTPALKTEIEEGAVALLEEELCSSAVMVPKPSDEKTETDADAPRPTVTQKNSWKWDSKMISEKNEQAGMFGGNSSAMFVDDKGLLASHHSNGTAAIRGNVGWKSGVHKFKLQILTPPGSQAGFGIAFKDAAPYNQQYLHLHDKAWIFCNDGFRRYGATGNQESCQCNFNQMDKMEVVFDYDAGTMHCTINDRKVPGFKKMKLQGKTVYPYAYTTYHAGQWQLSDRTDTSKDVGVVDNGMMASEEYVTKQNVTFRFIQDMIDECNSGFIDVSYLQNSHFLSQFAPVFFSRVQHMISLDKDLMRNSIDYFLQLSLVCEKTIGAEPSLGADIEKYHTKIHTKVIETPHPYDIAQVYKWNLNFNENVHWMTVKLDKECSSMQEEDCLRVSFKKGDDLVDPADKDKKDSEEKQIVKYLHFFGRGDARHWDEKSHIIPGNELNLMFQTASMFEEGVEARDDWRYGVKCTVTGFEMMEPAKSPLVHMAKDLAFLSSYCIDELVRISDPAKLDWSSASILGGGLIVDEQDEEEEVVEESKVESKEEEKEEEKENEEVEKSPKMTFKPLERTFLMDFVEMDSDKAGGRLAHWLENNGQFVQVEEEKEESKEEDKESKKDEEKEKEDDSDSKTEEKSEKAESDSEKDTSDDKKKGIQAEERALRNRLIEEFGMSEEEIDDLGLPDRIDDVEGPIWDEKIIIDGEERAPAQAAAGIFGAPAADFGAPAGPAFGGFGAPPAGGAFGGFGAPPAGPAFGGFGAPPVAGGFGMAPFGQQEPEKKEDTNDETEKTDKDNEKEEDNKKDVPVCVITGEKAIRSAVAAVLWHLDLVTDAMTASGHLKFVKEKFDAGEFEDKEQPEAPAVLKALLALFEHVKSTVKLVDTKKEEEEKKKKIAEEEEEEEEDEKNKLAPPPGAFGFGRAPPQAMAARRRRAQPAGGFAFGQQPGQNVKNPPKPGSKKLQNCKGVKMVKKLECTVEKDIAFISAEKIDMTSGKMSFEIKIDSLGEEGSKPTLEVGFRLQNPPLASRIKNLASDSNTISMNCVDGVIARKLFCLPKPEEYGEIKVGDIFGVMYMYENESLVFYRNDKEIARTMSLDDEVFNFVVGASKGVCFTANLGQEAYSLKIAEEDRKENLPEDEAADAEKKAAELAAEEAKTAPQLPSKVFERASLLMKIHPQDMPSTRKVSIVNPSATVSVTKSEVPPTVEELKMPKAPTGRPMLMRAASVDSRQMTSEEAKAALTTMSRARSNSRGSAGDAMTVENNDLELIKPSRILKNACGHKITEEVVGFLGNGSVEANDVEKIITTHEERGSDRLLGLSKLKDILARDMQLEGQLEVMTHLADSFERLKDMYIVDDIPCARIQVQNLIKNSFHSLLGGLVPVLSQTHSKLSQNDDPDNQSLNILLMELLLKCWSIQLTDDENHVLETSGVFSALRDIISKSGRNGSSSSSSSTDESSEEKQKSTEAEASMERSYMIQLTDVSGDVVLSSPSGNGQNLATLTDGTTNSVWSNEEGRQCCIILRNGKVQKGDENDDENDDEDNDGNDDGEKKVAKGEQKDDEPKNDDDDDKDEDADKGDDNDDDEGEGDARAPLKEFYVFIDNERNENNRCNEVQLFSGKDAEYMTPVCKVKVPMKFIGWLPIIPDEPVVDVLSKLAFNGGSTTATRVFGLKVFSTEQVALKDAKTSGGLARVEALALTVFRSLASKVFGGLMSDKSKDKEKEGGDGKNEEKKEDNAVPSAHPKLIKQSSSVDISNLRDHVAEMLTGNKLAGLEMELFNIIEDDIRSEMLRRNAEHKSKKTDEEKKESPESEVYLLELISLVQSLTNTSSGRSCVKAPLLISLLKLLGICSASLQKTIIEILSRCLPDIDPSDLDDALEFEELETTFTVSEDEVLSLHQSGDTVSAYLLLLVAKGLQVSIRRRLESQMEKMDANQENTWIQGDVAEETATALVEMFGVLRKSNKWSFTILNFAKKTMSFMPNLLRELSSSPDQIGSNEAVWLAMASMGVFGEDYKELLETEEETSAPAPEAAPLPFCDNHNNGVTLANWHCKECSQNLCNDCEHIIHLSADRAEHDREEMIQPETKVDMKLDFHEGCVRARLPWLLVVVDLSHGRGIIELREETTSPKRIRGSLGSCRFCGVAITNENRQLGLPASHAMEHICRDEECQEKAKQSCTATLSCGHCCGGIVDEDNHLPCLHGCETSVSVDAEDFCMICWTDPLGQAPSVQLGCGHIFHKECIETLIERKYSGPRINFRFMQCPLCKTDIKHEALNAMLKPWVDLREEVAKKALMRAQFEGVMSHPDVTEPTGPYYEDVRGFAMNRYAYYQCYTCKHAYFGGERACLAAGDGNDNFDPKDLICGGCVPHSAEQDCPKHGRDYLEWKCRFCCSVAVYFCFGTTHFCERCHSDPSRMQQMETAGDLPDCPAGPLGQCLEGDCPLSVEHPATGTEFALGCALCRNKQTF
eukprot:TRINITY_DN766_c0_g1_i2.p1 TRINITY_DN766_c0_g1~~TRINITY_DN766_c0_g1_i2.p1  ORF type:complete len:3952 (+),score=1641.27 TRINITY_DN766_c0_g1_i2:307-12162(+)